MKKTNRNRWEIILFILDVATIRVRPIDILYETRLSYELQQEYLHLLVKHELLEESIEGRRKRFTYNYLSLICLGRERYKFLYANYQGGNKTESIQNQDIIQNNL